MQSGPVEIDVGAVRAVANGKAIDAASGEATPTSGEAAPAQPVPEHDIPHWRGEAETAQY